VTEDAIRSHEESGREDLARTLKSAIPEIPRAYVTKAPPVLRGSQPAGCSGAFLSLGRYSGAP
jgi:hypothetical protein